jgi:trehalose synthase
MSQGGTDLSYDFVTRPAYHHALVTGDTEFLRLMLRLMRDYGIDPATLIHALQNHDELTLELVHFWGAHKDDPFAFRGGRVSGAELRAKVHADMFGTLIGARAPYNLKAGDGVACTTASLIAATLGIADVSKLTADQAAQVQRLHLLLAFYNAFQPGVFALSGWDLVGALTLPADAITDKLADGDTRWINRGAYDLLGAGGEARSAADLPQARALYGPVPEQLGRPDSFASRLARMLEVRAQLKLYAARQLEVPGTHAKGLLVMVHELPDAGGTQVTAINFGREPVDEIVALAQPVAGVARFVDALDPAAAPAEVSAEGVRIRLGGYEGKALVVER